MGKATLWRAQRAFKDSMIHWILQSTLLSHFAAFFIDARTGEATLDRARRSALMLSRSAATWSKEDVSVPIPRGKL